MVNNNLFAPAPENQKESAVDQILQNEKFEEKSQQDRILLFSSRNRIYILPHFGRKPIMLAEREKEVLALCYHKNKIYDAGTDCQIYETFNNKPIAQRDDWIRTLCSYDGDLYDGGDYNKIYKTFDSELIAERKDAIFALCSHNMTLYDGGQYKEIRNTKLDNSITSCSNPITALASFEEKLYYAGASEIRVAGKEDYEDYNSDFIGYRKDNVTAICHFGGEVYDAGFEGRIYRTQHQDSAEICYEGDNYITSLISVPKKLVAKHIY